MGYKINLNQGDKILSITSSLISIISVGYAHFFRPELFNFAVIFAVVLIALTIIGLAIKIALQSKRIHTQEDKISNLEDSNRIQEERIVQLEQKATVPFFQKWHLFYTNIWRSASSFLNNPITLFEIRVNRELVGTGKVKDNHVKYIFSGECVEMAKSFKFCIAGAGNIPLEKIKFHAMDLTLNQELDYSVLKNTQDSNVKYIEIFFRRIMYPGGIFNIELSWQWPKTAFVKTDYFSIPNIYSITTKRIVIDLHPTPDMELSTVETYKLGLSDAEPILVEHLYKNNEGFYRSIIDNPENNADYITYYGSGS